MFGLLFDEIAPMVKPVPGRGETTGKSSTAPDAGGSGSDVASDHLPGVNHRTASTRLPGPQQALDISLAEAWYHGSSAQQNGSVPDGSAPHAGNRSTRFEITQHPGTNARAPTEHPTEHLISASRGIFTGQGGF
jgi:hypothetical protein